MKTINKEILDQFFELAAEKLSGEWILLGGAVLPYLGRQIRPTIDIDLSGKSLKGTEKQLELMEIAESLSLPVEAINTAAEFFIRKIKGFENELVLLFSKKQFQMYRPNVNLFIQLKMSRLSESDLNDCHEFLRFAKSVGEKIDHQKLQKLVRKELQKGDGRIHRLKKLLQALRK